MDFVALSRKYDLKEKPTQGIYRRYWFSITIALLFRFLYIAHGMLLIHTVAQKWETKFLHYLYLLVFGILVEGCYTVYIRGGRESKYFSVSLYLYILICVPPVWVLHFKRQPYLLQEHESKENEFEKDLKIVIIGSTKFNSDDEDLYQINENLFMTLLVLSRWFLPKDDLNREDTFTLLISNLSMAADAHEIFYSPDSHKVLRRQVTKNDDHFAIYVLIAWSVSLPLFTINAATETYFGKKFRLISRRHVEKIFGNFCWKYITSMVLMDGPYFLVRIIGVIDYKIIGYQNILYIFKNAVQILVQIYSILGKIFFPDGLDLIEQNMPIRVNQKLNNENKKA